MINNEWGFITFPTHTDPEQRAIARLKIASEMSLEHYKTPLLLTHSGGKDSCVLTELALRAEIPFEVLHAHTTADAPVISSIVSPFMANAVRKDAFWASVA